MDLITTGRSAASRGSLGALAAEVQKMLSVATAPTRFDALLKALQAQAQHGHGIHLDPHDLRDVLNTLAKQDFLLLAGNPHNPEIRVAQG